VVEPPSREEILRLRAWLAAAELPAPPLHTMPGVEAYNVELKRQQLLAATSDVRYRLDLKAIHGLVDPHGVRVLGHWNEAGMLYGVLRYARGPLSDRGRLYMQRARPIRASRKPCWMR
jgi:hypothetical protein